MKTFLSTVVTFLLIISINAQSVSSFFERLEDGDDYAVITINKEMFRMIASFDAESDDEGVKDLIKNIKRVRVFVNDETAEYTDFKELKALAGGTSMTNLISVKDGGERVELFTKPTNDDKYVDGLILLVHEEDQNVFIEIDGRINLDDLAKLTDKMDIDGFDHLKKIGKGN